jgi:hypothetical protein
MTAAHDRLEQVVVLTERLTKLLADQAVAFESHRPQDAAASMEETTRLANAYRHEAKRLRENPEEVQSAPLELRRRLLRATEAFDAVVARQGRALHAAKTVTEGLVQAIAQEVVKQRASTAGYGPDGAKNLGQASAAITLNRRA